MHTLHRLALCLLMGTFLVGTGASAGQILLDEDFNDGIADGFTFAPPVWGVEAGELRCSLEGVAVWGHAFYEAALWTDYIYEVDLKVEGSINHVIRFRIQDPDNCYEVNVRGGSYDDAFLQKYVGGVMTQLAEVADVFIEAGVWHHFRVMVHGATVTAFVDNQFLFEHTDDTNPFVSGGVGVSCFTGGIVGYQDVYADNMLVVAPVVSVERSSWSSVKSLYR